jgi:amidase
VDPSVRQAVQDAARLCGTLGHVVEEIRCPFEGSVIDDFVRFWALSAWLQVLTGRLGFHWGFKRSEVEPWTRRLLELFAGEKRLAVAATRRLRRFSTTYAAAIGPYDMLVSPTLAQPAPMLGYLAADLPFEVALDRVLEYCAFTPIQNASGAPAISLPLGRTTAGLPIGVQFAAAHGNDRTLLELALSIEAASPWQRLAPREAWAASTPR